MHFDYSSYYRSHGKAPRGRGGWGFQDVNQHSIDDVFWASPGNYSDAKREAAKHFAAQPGFSGFVRVMP